ncbi:hypothetical protein D9M70_601900 [compost metagenome]
MISRFTARSKISDRHCTCASASVLPALMPLLRNRFSIRLDGKYTTSPSDWRTYGSEQMPRSSLPELVSNRCEPRNSPSRLKIRRQYSSRISAGSSSLGPGWNQRSFG